MERIETTTGLLLWLASQPGISDASVHLRKEAAPYGMHLSVRYMQDGEVYELKRLITHAELTQSAIDPEKVIIGSMANTLRCKLTANAHSTSNPTNNTGQNDA